jgi:geranylgeranyl diphosphate synthase, type III
VGSFDWQLASSRPLAPPTKTPISMAMYFQIRDDFINLADEEYMKSKSFCEDLTEGKFSFPIIHCIRQNEKDTRLINILKQRTEDIDIKRYAQRVMREAGSLKYTRDKCSCLKTEIVKQIEGFGGNPTMTKLLDLLDVQLEGMDEASTEVSSPSHKKSHHKPNQL